MIVVIIITTTTNQSIKTQSMGTLHCAVPRAALIAGHHSGCWTTSPIFEYCCVGR